MSRPRAVRKHFREPDGLAGDESGGPATGRMIRAQPRGALVCSRLGGEPWLINLSRMLDRVMSVGRQFAVMTRNRFLQAELP